MLHRLAEIAEAQGRPGDQEALDARALARSEAWAGDEPGAIALADLAGRRSNLARVLARRGSRDEARALLLANRRALHDRPGAPLDEAGVAARAYNSMLFRHLDLGAPPDPDGDARLAAIDAIASVEAERWPAEAWARSAADALGLDDPGRPATFRAARAVDRLAASISSLASDERKWGQLDRAGRTVDRLIALAGLAIARCPGDPVAHLVLAGSCDQMAKNAWRVDDRAAVRLALRRAIAANRRALDLTPYDEFARHQLERRQRKLDDLLHPR